MKQQRTLRTDERGASPFVLAASLVMFTLVSAGLAAGLIAAMHLSTQMQVAAQLHESASTAAQSVTRLGYDAVIALPAEAPVQLTVGARTVEATRTVEVNPTSRTARVSVTVGRLNGTEFTSRAHCSATPKNCLTATELVTGAGLGVAP